MTRLFGGSSECCLNKYGRGQATLLHSLETHTDIWQFSRHAEQNKYLNLWVLYCMKCLALANVKYRIMSGFVLSMYVMEGGRSNS